MPTDSRTLTTTPPLTKSKSNPESPTSPPNNPIPIPTTTTTTTTKSLHRISLHPTLTPYRRRLYRTLLSIPPGRWTTYAALSAHLASSPRAVGNALRTNPFAPEVPCHRVLGSGGFLGGYKGVWAGGTNTGKGEGEGDGGKGGEKKRLLEEEGVVFDGEGRARGVCFGGLVEVGMHRTV